MVAVQLPLPLVWTGDHQANDFYLGECNQRAVDWLDRFPLWNHHATVLTGPTKSGKSHLASMFSERHGDRVAVIDNANPIKDEAELFHMFNATKEAGRGLLIVARDSPALWSLSLPDLKSRLAAAPLVTIDPPDDPVLAAVLIKQLRDGGLLAPPAVIGYLITRMERSFAAAYSLAKTLNEAALANQRALTVKFAAKVIDELASPQLSGYKI